VILYQSSYTKTVCLYWHCTMLMLAFKLISPQLVHYPYTYSNFISISKVFLMEFFTTKKFFFFYYSGCFIQHCTMNTSITYIICVQSSGHCVALLLYVCTTIYIRLFGFLNIQQFKGQCDWYITRHRVYCNLNLYVLPFCSVLH